MSLGLAGDTHVGARAQLVNHVAGATDTGTGDDGDDGVGADVAQPGLFRGGTVAGVIGSDHAAGRGGAGVEK